jgi:inosine-uridine nucleoside N-ribohydrolase
MGSTEKVIIIAIGAITNVASAILKCPEIASRASVIWLGGHALHLNRPNVEFNLRGDIAAAQVVFDSGIDLVQVACQGVCSEVATTYHELEFYLRGKNAVCDYLADIVKQVSFGKYAKSRVIWDVTAATVLLAQDALEMDERVCPKIRDDGTYGVDFDKHHYLYVTKLYRDRVFEDLFRTLADER